MLQRTSFDLGANNGLPGVNMNLLQELLDKELSGENIAAEYLVSILGNKLNEKGITLSSKQKVRLKKSVLAGSCLNLSFDRWRFWDQRNIKITLDKYDLANIDQAIDNLTNILPELLDSVSTESANIIFATLKKDWPKHAEWQEGISRQFVANLYARWEVPFSMIQMLMAIVREFGEITNERLRKTGNNSWSVDVQTRLHARACQVGSEVIALLHSGFADGAMARWRTLHEIAVVSLFISSGDENLAEQYSLHQTVESRRAMHEYGKHSARLGFDPIAQDESDEIEKKYDALILRFGRPFREPYGWAASTLKVNKPSFADIECAVKVDHLRPYYRMASHSIHANPKGAFFRLGLLGENELLLAGPSNFGFADPGQNTAMSLVTATMGLARLDFNIDGIVIIKLIDLLAREVANSFVAVQQDMIINE